MSPTPFIAPFIGGAAGGSSVVEQEPVPVAAEHEWQGLAIFARTARQHFTVIERLLHAITEGMIVVFRLYYGNRNIGLMEQDVIGKLGLAALALVASGLDLAFGQRDFFQ